MLPSYVINEILDTLLKETDLVMKQEFMCSLGSLINANRMQIKIFQKKIETILLNELENNNTNIQEMCIKVIKILISTISNHLNEKLLDKLIQIGTSTNVDEVKKKEICDLFISIDTNSKKFYKEKIKLANLTNNSNSEFLNELNAFVYMEDGFLEQNYNQMKNIIDKEPCSEIQARALDILYRSKAKSNMTNELMESVALLYESTMSPDIEKACLALLKEANKSGKQLSSRGDQIVNEKLIREENIRKLCQSNVYVTLKEQFQLSDQFITDFFKSLKLIKAIKKVENLTELIQLTMQENPNYYDNSSFVLIIEQCLLMDRIIETALPCYCEIIKANKMKKVENCLKKLANNVLNKNDTSIFELTSLIQAINAAFKPKIQVPNVCLTLLVVNLENNDDVIRSISFKALRIIKDDKRYITNDMCKTFDKWCESALNNLSKQIGIQIEKNKDYLDILEIVVSVKFIDLNVFKENKRDVWKRELLVSNLFEIFNANKSEQSDFYTNWLSLEEKFRFHKSTKLLSHIKCNQFHSFDQIIELISIMLETPKYDDIIQILNSNEKCLYSSIKQEWCMNKIRFYFANNASHIKKTYLKKLVETFCFKFKVNFIIKLLNCIKSIDNLREFEHLIDFCSKENIKESDLTYENLQLNELKRLLEVNALCNQIEQKFKKVQECLNNTFLTLLSKDWNFNQLSSLVASFKLNKHYNKQHSLIDALNVIRKYNIMSSNFEKCKQILDEASSLKQCIEEFNKLAIENNFQLEGKIKDVSELFDELKKPPNDCNKNLIDYTSCELKREFEFIKSETLKSEVYTDTQLAICKWNEKQIQLWSKELQRNEASRKKMTNFEGIAVIKQANFIQTSHILTDTQILCSLIALNNNNHIPNLKGKLLEVATGEGKSTIVCILAIINALRGNNIEVITSSPVLAERDAKQKAKLYKMFNLRCCDNNDKAVYIKGFKECYKAEVVYGELSQFQFDILRDNYSKLGTMGKRKCEIAIVDEVDSMLIDDSSKIARLASTVAGMDHFQAIYVFIWQRLISIKEKFVVFNNKTYFIEGKIEFENGKITLQIIDANNNISKINDLEQYLLNANAEEISKIGDIVGNNIEEYLVKSLEIFLDGQIKDSKLYIPHNFKEFFEKQKSKWILNSIEAITYQENIHYIVQDGQIKPVDYYSTGIIQSSTNWSDGLHQFLQLKHNLKVNSFLYIF